MTANPCLIMARVMLFCTLACMFYCCSSKTDAITDIKTESDKKIARIFDKTIYLSQLAPFIAKDSSIMVSAYINKIVQEEAIVKKATEKGFEAEEIEARTYQFRNSLIVIDFQREYFKSNLDTNVSDIDLKTYYDQNQKSFQLSEDIFKGYFIKIPENTPRIEKLKELMKSKKPSDFQELKSYCLRYANLFIINTDTWSQFPKNPEMLKVNNVENLQQSIRSGQVISHTKEDHLYLVRLFDFKHARQVSPFEYAKQDIKMLVLNKRKILAWSKYCDQVVKEAKSNNNFEIYQ